MEDFKLCPEKGETVVGSAAFGLPPGDGAEGGSLTA